MKIYLFDCQTFLYTGESEATPGDIPGSWTYPSSATSTPPPEDIPADKLARWNGTEWELVDAPTSEELREAAYRLEADPLFAKAQHYQNEADALHESGDTEAAEIAENKAKELRAQGLAVKQEIRKRYPDSAE